MDEEQNVEEVEIENLENEELIDSSEVEIIGEESEWTPDFTYDVKGESKEFDEYLRSSITSKDEEDKIRDLYTRADGLDTYKGKVEKYESENTDLNSQVDLMMSGYTKLKEVRDSKNIDGLIESLGMTNDEAFQDAILDWAIKKADFLTLPQEEREKISTSTARDREYESLKNEISSLRNSQAQASTESEMGRMRNILSSDKWSETSKALDNYGINFEDEVIVNGTNHARTTGVEPTIEQAIEMTAKKYGLLINNTKNNNDTQVNTVKTTSLPRVRRTSNSSVNDSIKSIDDLKRLAVSMGI